MSKMNFKQALKELATGNIKGHKLYVACESYVGVIGNWHVELEEESGSAYVYANVCSTFGSLPFIPDEGKDYHYGDLTKWYLDTTDYYFTTEEEATAYAAECIFKYVKSLEDLAEEA